MLVSRRVLQFALQIITIPAIITAAINTNRMMKPARMAQVVGVPHRVIVGAAVIPTVKCGDSAVRLRPSFRGSVRFRVRQRVKL